MFIHLTAGFLLVSLSILGSVVKGSGLHENPIDNSPFHRGHAPRGSLEVDARGTQSQVAMMWFAGWHQDSTPAFPISKVKWSSYTHVTYSFAFPTNSCQLSMDGSEGVKLDEFVGQAHQHGVKALIAIGGWTGSRFFSSCVGSAANRTAFVKTTTAFVKLHKLDGVNIDWEYPNSDAIGCNVKSPQDSANYLAYLKELRSSLPKPYLITIAAGITPLPDASGNPLKDVSGFAQVLDFVALMVYDIWGSWSSSVGPNAPLNDTCAAPQNQQGSAVAAAKAWSKAGMPVNQLVLGVPAYGHSFLVQRENAFVSGSTTKLASYNRFDASAYPKGDAWDSDAGVDVCGNNEPNGGTYNFWGLVNNGFLDQTGKSAHGIAYRFDDCSQTAYVYNSTSQIMVSFDDAQSFCSKGKFISSTKLAGFAMWEAGGDYNNILLGSILSCMKL
ncbi:glycoside hydrolase family 18 protein [Collybiopsis luxurians FD-317 M1]|uniref:Glycoside hydrolase family 18 protein n=1 Tax=Collybiopsis luxurians FD-317 M1 TaxID=944289 RepID=A0A0D0BF47_9AGAR|nr:glycoside hydrolase family 18 protein [Collybiopsis luxurians FD-317 M1]